MVFTVEIRGVGETEWKLLKEKVSGALSLVGFHCVSGWRVPGAGDGVGCAGQSAGGGADGADGRQPVLDRQYAAEDHGDWRATRAGGQGAGEVACGGRAE